MLTLIQSESIAFMHRLIVGKILIILSILFLVSSTNCLAQTLNIKVYNVEDGLSQSIVKSIVQDRDGYLWLGTEYGLSKFDGKTFEIFTIEHGLVENDIESGYLDNDGNIWFGHKKGSITKYNWKTRQFEEFKISGYTANLPNCEITQISQDSAGHFWFTTYGAGVYYYNGDTIIVISKENGLLDNKVMSMSQANDGTLWFATLNGVSICDPARFPRLYCSDSLTVRDGLPSNAIYSIFTDSKGNTWLGTKDAGLIKYTPTGLKETFRKFQIFSKKHGLKSNLISTINEDKDGLIWIGTLGGGVSKFISSKPPQDKEYFQTFTTENGLSNNNICSFFQDIEGNFWFGTDGGGICKFRDERFEIYSVKEGLIDRGIWNILEDRQGNLWFGTDGGLTRYTPAHLTSGKVSVKNFTEIQKIPIRYVYATYQDTKGFIWFVSFDKALFRFNPQNQYIRIFTKKDGLKSTGITSINEDKDGLIWLGTIGQGIIKYDPKTYTFHQITTDNGLSSDNISSIFRDSKNNLWIGTEDNGIIKYDGQHLYNYSREQGYPLESAISISEDGTGNLWIVDSNGNLYKFDGKVFYNYALKNRLVNETIYSVICDESNAVWLGLTRGLAKLSPHDTSIMRHGNLKDFPILESNQDAASKDSKGNLWFGTIAGAVKYYPGVAKHNIRPPYIHISNLRIFLEDAPMPQYARFPYNKNYLTFHFNGICLTAPEKVKYVYKLGGFDPKWSPETSENFATYSNLPHGEYTFKVKACNNDGVWNPVPATYKFEILTPFWQTWWFYSLIVACVSLSLYTGIRKRIRNIEKDKLILESKVKERTNELISEKEKVETAFRALRESETKFRELTEMTTTAIFIYKGEHFQYVNPALEKITGYTAEELLRMKFWDVVHPEFQELIKQRGLARQKGEHVPAKYEFKIITKSGQERWLDFSAQAIIYKGKHAAIGTAFDITERKKYVQNLKDSEESYRSLFNSIPDAIYVQDHEGRFLDVNRGAVEMYGYSKDELVGNTPAMLAHSEKVDMEATFIYLQDAFKGIPQQFEWWGVRKNGESFPKEVILSKSQYFGKDVLIAIARDITERKRTESALLEEKERLAVTLRSIGDGVITTTTEGNIILMNKIAEELTGWSQEKAIGKHLSEVFYLVNEKTKKSIYDPIKKVMHTGGVIGLANQTMLISKSGTERIISDSGAPIRDKDNKIIGVVLVFRDITEKRKMEEELLKAQKLESVGLLAGGIAHDFNNILTAILGNISLAKAYAQTDKKLIERLTEAEKASIRAKDLTQQLLTFAKGGAPVKKSASIAELIMDSVKFTLRGSSIRCEYFLDDNLWIVKVDAGQISQVIQNLVINAQQAMPEGGTIWVEAENFHLSRKSGLPLTERDYIKISVRDEGTGIMAKYLSNIFDPYFTTKQQGSGLGLATAYSIVKNHDGHIMVESQLGTGSNFQIYLPAYPELVQEKKKIIEDKISAHSKGVILLMDDEQMVREVAGAMLNEIGFDVVEAADGKEAIELYQQALKNNHPFDAVIMDLTIPGGMGGKATIAKLLEIDPEVNALVSSGYSNDRVMAKYADFGFKGVIKKPFMIGELRNALNRILA